MESTKAVGRETSADAAGDAAGGLNSQVDRNGEFDGEY